MPFGRYYGLQSIAVDAAKNGTRELVAAPGVGYRIAVFGMNVGASAAGTVTFKTAGTGLTGAIPVAQYGHIWIALNDEAPGLVCAENEALNVTLSANADLDGWLIYAVVSANESLGPYYSIVNAAVSAVADDTTELVAAAGAGKKIELLAANLSGDVAGSIVFKSAATALTGTIPLAATTPYQIDFNPNASVMETAANEALNLTTVSAAVTGWITYAVTDV